MPDRPALSELFSNFDSIENFRGGILPVGQLASINLRQHPLGFAYAVIGKEVPYSLRLHVWPDFNRYEQNPYWPIHNHRFDLVSRVFAGAVANRLYRVERSDVENRRLYNVGYEGEQSTTSRTDERVSVEVERSEEVTAPGLYSIDAGAFHETSVAANIFTATFVITRDSLTDSDVKTVGDLSGEVSYKYSRLPVPKGDQEAILAKLGPLLENR